MAITIIKTGKLPETQSYTSTCDRCNTVYTFQRSDLEYVTHTQIKNEEVSYSINCPLCSHKLYIDNRGLEKSRVSTDPRMEASKSETVQVINAKINNLYKTIIDIQSKCLHIEVSKEHKSNTGNYAPVDDRYLTEFTCKTCEKHWSEEGIK